MMPTDPQISHSLKRTTGRPFPWHCPKCGQKEVRPHTVHYECQRAHGGTLYKVVVPQLVVPVCDNCGERVFNYTAEEQIIEALQRQLLSSADPPTEDNSANGTGVVVP
jgi:hypothetical protein